MVSGFPVFFLEELSAENLRTHSRDSQNFSYGQLWGISFSATFAWMRGVSQRAVTTFFPNWKCELVGEGGRQNQARFALTFLYLVLPPSFMNHHHFFMHFICTRYIQYVRQKGLSHQPSPSFPARKSFLSVMQKGLMKSWKPLAMVSYRWTYCPRGVKITLLMLYPSIWPC